jgi:transaldolase/glucose-6-phosphate isomerase
MNPVKALQTHDQAVWLDFLARGFTAKGGLKQLIDDDGVRGVTSNPAIFEKAIGGSDEYDEAIAQLLEGGDRSVTDLYEALAVADIQQAADVLRPVYDQLDGADGFVSLEVSPYLANDTKATVAEAERLWHDVDRKNLMIKVPATPEGLPAIEQLTAKGISVNITLLFSQAVYRQVAEAYLAGLETYIGSGGDPSHVASVASFFVSRIDSAVDGELDALIAKVSTGEAERLQRLKGKVAIANARLAYQDFKKLFSGERWQRLAARGAKPQRLLWASTGTKNKAYSDVLYVEQLIGPQTVNTIPPATLDAFRDHGAVQGTLEQDIDGARRTLADLAASGISLDTITAALVEDGVRLFADAADKLLGALAAKRVALLGNRINRQRLVLGDTLAKAVASAAEAWRKDAKVRRVWQHDKSVWTGTDEDGWLGWLDAAAEETRKIIDYETFAEWVRGEGFSDAVVLGMGGSSLGPEVLAATFPRADGFPKLRVLDTVDPGQIRALEQAIDLAKTLFIVSSKSGSTIEPNRLKDYFFARVSAAIGDNLAGSHFVAITDPGSTLEKAAREQGFTHIFHGDPTIGGRYSVLSPFGLAPAAAAGIDIGKFLETTRGMIRTCAADVPPAHNPAVQLGLAMALAGQAGRDKVTMIASPDIADLGAWAEQLIAESTGKNGQGLIPIDGEPPGDPAVYGNDRFFIAVRTESGDDAHTEALAALEQAGHPVVHIVLKSAEHIGQEFFRLEMATAVAGAVLGINPFDQPDVEIAKAKARELTAAFETNGTLPEDTPIASGDGFTVFTDAANAEALHKAGADGSLESWVRAQLSRVTSGDYVAFLAYLARNTANVDALQRMRLPVRAATRAATTVGFGPRFLHSTGQAHKGGPNSGVFFQITADCDPDLAIPGQKAGFGIIEAAQARGDFDALTERGRRALRIHLSGNVEGGLATLGAAFDKALA